MKIPKNYEICVSEMYWKDIFWILFIFKSIEIKIGYD
jgi:hypothetical protein